MSFTHPPPSLPFLQLPRPPCRPFRSPFSSFSLPPLSRFPQTSRWTVRRARTLLLSPRALPIPSPAQLSSSSVRPPHPLPPPTAIKDARLPPRTPGHLPPRRRAGRIRTRTPRLVGEKGTASLPRRFVSERRNGSRSLREGCPSSRGRTRRSGRR